MEITSKSSLDNFNLNKKIRILNLVFPFSLVIFFLFYILKFDLNGYIGGMDGYYYGLLIKLYKSEFFFKDIDYVSPVNYPPYYFYLIGKIANFFHISNLGYLQFYGTVGSYFLFITLYLKIVSKYLAYPLTFISLLIFFLFSFLNEEYSASLMQKPHELLALLFIPSFIFYVHSIKSNILCKKWLLITGFISGLAAGFHPAIIFPSMLSAIIFFLLLYVKNKKNTNFYSITFYFASILILTLLPYLFTFINTAMISEKIGPVLAINPDEFSFRFLALPFGLYWRSNLQNIINILGLLILVFAGKKYYKQEPGIFLYTYCAIAFNFLFFIALKVSFNFGYPMSAPHKFIISLQINSILALFFLVQESNYAKKINTFLGRFFNIFLIISLLFSYLIVYEYFKLNDISRGFEIGKARYNNLRQLSFFVTKLNKKFPIQSYIAEGEARFLEYYLPDKIINKLFYNEDFVSPFIDFKGRINSLKKSILSSPDDFLDVLHRENINLIIAENHDKKNENLKIGISVANTLKDQSSGKGYLKADEIIIPLTLLENLVESKRAILFALPEYKVFYILPFGKRSK